MLYSYPTLPYPTLPIAIPVINNESNLSWRWGSAAGGSHRLLVQCMMIELRGRRLMGPMAAHRCARDLMQEPEDVVAEIRKLNAGKKGGTRSDCDGKPDARRRRHRLRGTAEKN
jgi:hypothetical protein